MSKDIVYEVYADREIDTHENSMHMASHEGSRELEAHGGSKEFIFGQGRNSEGGYLSANFIKS